jgi:hypothetical protein
MVCVYMLTHWSDSYSDTQGSWVITYADPECLFHYYDCYVGNVWIALYCHKYFALFAFRSDTQHRHHY